MARIQRLLGLCLAAALVVGCSGQVLLDGAAATSVTVTLDQVPVEGAAVVFTPVNGGRSASGQTNANGVAQMGTTSVGDGVMPGNYKIVVVKSVEEPSTAPEGDDTHQYQGRGAPLYPKQIYLVPKKYLTPKTSGLTATVKADEVNEVTLELTSP